MSRKDRRAVKAVTKKLPPIPNISGTDACCGNCKFSADPKIISAIVTHSAARELAAGRPAPQPVPDDEVFCNFEPQERLKKLFGWCSQHRPK